MEISVIGRSQVKLGRYDVGLCLAKNNGKICNFKNTGLSFLRLSKSVVGLRLMTSKPQIRALAVVHEKALKVARTKPVSKISFFYLCSIYLFTYLFVVVPVGLCDFV